LFLKVISEHISRTKVLFEEKERQYVVLLFFGILIMGVLEVVGIASIAPFMAVISDPNIIHENTYLSTLYQYFNFDNDNEFLQILGLAALIILVFSNGISAFVNWGIIFFSRRQAHLISMRLLKQYLSQPYLFFLDRNTADLGKNLLSEVDRSINGAVLPGMLALSRIIIAIFILIFLFYIDTAVALIAMVLMGGTYSLIFVLIRKRLHRIGVSSTDIEKRRFKTAHEAMSGIKEIKLRNSEKAFLDRFELPSSDKAKFNTYSQLSTILPRYLLDTIAFGGILSLMIYMVYAGKTSGEIIPIVTLYALAGYRLMPALQQIYASSTQLKYNLPALDILINDLNDNTDIPQTKYKETQLLPFSKQLVLEGISFKYPNTTKPILENLSLKIESNTTVGLIGITGSGKTTLVDILLGLLIPQQGRMIVDETEVTPMNISGWQKNLGYVPQTIYLTDDSIEHNIAFAAVKDKIDKNKVREAAKLAELDEFIQTLPQGYQTDVGERGVRLSGGQRQRIGIARTLYHDPKILVLDEATSALDGVTENVIMDAINNLSHKKTIVMIAHRLSTVKECDVIHIMENGCIIKSGTYNELLENSENFRNMANV
jgi:ATP-binding cassette, subfamily B, bacterial PglK